MTMLRSLLLIILVGLGFATEGEAEPQAGGDLQIRQLLIQLQDRSKGVDAVDALVALRDPRVKIIFACIEDRSLAMYQEAVVRLGVKSQAEDGSNLLAVHDIFSPSDTEGAPQGEPIGLIPEGEVGRFKESRKARKAVIKKLAVIGLFLEDPLERIASAKDVGNKRQTEALPKLRELMVDDPVEKVRFVAEESACIIVAAGQDPEATLEQVLAAVRRLGEMKSLRAYSLLEEHSRLEGIGKDSRAIYLAAMDRIEGHQTTVNWISTIFSGISLGTLLVLIALGLAITFGLMGVINMAHGEMLMIGAVATWACYEFMAPYVGDWYYVIAFPVSFLAAAAIGILIEFCIVRFLYKRPLDSMLATIGVSIFLVQAVRLWKGDNLGMQTPKMLGGGWEVMQDVILPYNRLFLIGLTILCVLSVIVIFRYTRFGLMLRATVQNRDMAKAMGVNTRLVDLSTFALGSGLAALAGYGLVLLTNPTPEMGSTYIVKSFLVTVLGGVGKMAGVIVGGMGIGGMEKILEPLVIIEEPLRIFDATWSQVAVLLIVIGVMTRKPGGLFPDKGRLSDQADKSSSWSFRPNKKLDRNLFLSLAGTLLLFVPFLYLIGGIGLGDVNKYGYFASFAICALGLELLWGYMGLLSLCQFLFFALGGYAMGLYLINHGPMSSDGIPMALSVVMSDVGERQAPWFLPYFDNFAVAILLGMLLTGLLAFVIGFVTFRSKVRGVYFAILSQAITFAAWFLFQKNELKLGGTNGLTNFDTILGFPIVAKNVPDEVTFGEWLGIALTQTRFWLYMTTVTVLLLAGVLCKWLVSSGFGRLLIATRDDETRLRFNGYHTWAIKTATFVIAALLAAIGGMLYVPQKGIITPHQIAPAASIMVVIWVALGGRATVWGPIIGAFAVSLLRDVLSSGAPDWYKDVVAWLPQFAEDFMLFLWSPESWKLILGLIFILVPLLLPGGLMSGPSVIRGLVGRNKSDITSVPPTPEASV